MELYTVLCISERSRAEAVIGLYTGLGLPMVLSALGRGTATASQLSLYGLEATEKTLVCGVADREKLRQLIRQAKRKLDIDIPGNGILLAVPMKSVGGGRTLAYLTDHLSPEGGAPELQVSHELILVILNEGHTDTVMDAARSAGAVGGTVLHAKGTGAMGAEKFLGVSLAQEKEVILIVSGSAEKAGIMRAIAAQAGPGTASGAVACSLPVSSVVGLRMLED